MCTLAAKKLNNSWYLLKTRDPVPWMRLDDEIALFGNSNNDKYRKYIIQNPNPREDGLYGGINEKGVAFVATYIPVTENQISYLRRPYVRLILDASSAFEAVNIIKDFNPRIGGNFFVADKDECYEIEGSPYEYFIQKIDQPLAKTNHYLHLKYENLQNNVTGFREWTMNRLSRAQHLIWEANNINDMEEILCDRMNANNHTAICMLDNEWENHPATSSAFIFDSHEPSVYYCQGNPLGNKFVKYNF